MSTRSSLRGDASGGSMRKVGDSLAAAKKMTPQWLFKKGYGGS